MKKTSIIRILVLICNIAVAQSNRAQSPVRFHSIINVGFLEGQTGPASQVQTVNGVQFKSWFVGLGLGLDLYRYRTVPLFLDLRKEFFSGADKLFVYADGGVSYSWVTGNQKIAYRYETFSNGFYADLGLGYKRKIGKNNAFLLSMGYSFKNLVDSYPYPLLYDFYPGDPPVSGGQQIKYSLNRLSIKMGWEF